MSTYRVKLTEISQKHIAKLYKNEPQAYKKAMKLIDELYEHPKIGTGHPEPLKGNRSNQWSRHITEKHRLIYEIRDTEVIVIVISAYGHYDDK
ncbi:MAG: Txe/YoeB family addiction module toxin [Bacteroidales bacterium]|nr:Txe/YoeB family addiction module toxin [Bacteroidales bacterium]